MRKDKKFLKVLSILLTLVLLTMIMPLGTFSVSAENAEFAGGSGTELDPYLIETKEQLANVRNNSDAYYKMISDIEFSDMDFVEGGAFYNDGQGWIITSTFNGHFDGNNHSIINLNVNSGAESASYVGLFGTNSGCVLNLKVANSTLKSVSQNNDAYVGGIAAINFGVIDNCTVDAELNALSNVSSYIGWGYAFAGGITGYNSFGGKISNCKNDGDISANANTYISYAGGIAGWNVGDINKCANLGDISKAEDVGGIVGYNDSENNIFDCYNGGTIYGSDHCGGIIGESHSSLENCYNTGSVFTDYQSAGGIVGFAIDCDIYNCFNTGNVCEKDNLHIYAGGIVGCGPVKIINCYNVGIITENITLFGGIIGAIHDGGEIDNSYYIDTNSKGTNYGDDLSVRCTSEEMKAKDTFVDFDFQNTWEFTEGNSYPYPTLKSNKHFLVNEDSPFNGGDGTEESPYLIENATQLDNIKLDMSAHYKLVKDIEFTDADFAEGGDFYNSGKGWFPIGTPSSNFTGVFDGNGYKIINLYANDSTQDNMGLFGYALRATIKNVSLENGNITGKDYVGGIVGYAGLSNISNSSFYGTIKGNNYVGGICGQLEYTSAITKASVGGNVEGNSYVGGICGYQKNVSQQKNTSSISLSSNSANINAICIVGGIVGGGTTFQNLINVAGLGKIYIEKCVNSGEIVADTHSAGGLIGSFSAQNDTYTLYINNSINTGNVSAETGAGGLIAGGSYDEKVLTNSYSVGNIVATDNFGGISGYDLFSADTCYYLDETVVNPTCTVGKAKSEDQLKKQTTFENWDFDMIWTMNGREDYLYPELADVPIIFSEDLTHKHEYNTQITQPTCTDGGYTTYTCSCGDSYIEDEVGSLGHNMIIDEAVKATCISTGLTEGQHCSRCNDVTVEQEITPKLKHEMVVDAAVSPTCTQTGLTAGCHCKNCDEATVEQEIVPALGHTESDAVIENSTEAKCGQAGSYDSVVYCPACGEETSRETVTVDALKHQYNEVVTAPTCTEGGYTTYTCSLCGDTYIDDEIGSLGHDIIIDKAVDATCTSTGLTKGQHCSRCDGATISQEVISVKSHEYTVKYDSSKHWEECVCGAKINTHNHTFGSNSLCDCGYKRVVNATIAIKNNNGSKTINYGETLKLTAVTNSKPYDAKIYWYVDGVLMGEGEVFNVNFESGAKVITVKLVDSNGYALQNADGNEISDSENVTVKSGFFQKLISFFKNLFGIGRVVVQSIRF